MEALATVAGSVIDGVASRTKDQQAQLRKVTGAIQRATKKRVSQQEAALQPIVQAIDDHAAVSTAESAIVQSLASATATTAALVSEVVDQRCDLAPPGFPVIWTKPDVPGTGTWWIVSDSGPGHAPFIYLTWGLPASTWYTDRYTRSGPFADRAAALAAWPTADEIAVTCDGPGDGTGTGGTGGGTGDGSGSTGGGSGFACPPGFIAYDDPKSCFQGQDVPPWFYWREEDRTWVSSYNPTCDPFINAKLPEEHKCVHCPVVCLPDSSGGGGAGDGGGSSGTGDGSGGSTGGDGGSGSGSGGSDCETVCPAPVVQCPAPQVTVNVAAPIVNVACTPDGTTTDTGGTGDDTGGGACPILVQPLASGHVGGPSGPDTEGGFFTLPDGSVVGPFPDGLPPGYTTDPLIACPPDCGPGAQGSWTDTGGKICVAGDVHDAGEGGLTALGMPDWSKLEVCVDIDAVSKKAENATTPLTTADFIKGIKGDEAALQSWVKKIEDAAPLGFQNLTGLVLELYATAVQFSAIGKEETVGCDLLKVVTPSIIRAVVGMLEKWFGLGLQDTKHNLDYWVNYHCPTFIPTVGAAANAFLADTIPESLWRCYVRANNTWDVPEMQVVRAQRTRPGVADVIRLANRGIIDPGKLPHKLRGEGILSDEEAEYFKRLADFIPGPGDIISFMKRDVFDEEVVKLYKYDAEFNEKYTGKAEAMGKAVGLTPEIAKYYWRMHWRVPSDSAAFQMLQRLRKGDVEDDVVTTEDDVDRLLGINDVAPEWRKRLMAISYRRPTSVQARKSFNIFAIKKSGLVSYIMDIGYTNAVADNLANTWEEDRYEYWAKHRVGKLYMAGAYSLYQFKEVLTRFASYGKEQAAVVAWLDGIVKATTRVKCIAATKHLFMMGTLTLAGAQTQLIGTGMDPAQAIEHTTEWACERSANGKLLPATKLCKWYQMGLMNTAEFSNRLGALGYFPADVLRIIGECDSQAKARTQAAATKKAIAAEKAAEKVAKKSQADAAKAEATLEKNLVKSERLIGKIAQLTGNSVETLGPDIRQRLAIAQAHAKLSQTEAVALLAAVVSELGKKGTTDWAPIWDALLSDAIMARKGDKHDE